MSHETHEEHKEEKKSIISFKNSFWLVIIIVGLFVAALNFIQSESGSGEGKGETTQSAEMNTPAEAPSGNMEQKADEQKPAAPAAEDTAAKGAH